MLKNEISPDIYLIDIDSIDFEIRSICKVSSNYVPGII